MKKSLLVVIQIGFITWNQRNAEQLILNCSLREYTRPKKVLQGKGQYLTSLSMSGKLQLAGHLGLIGSYEMALLVMHPLRYFHSAE